MDTQNYISLGRPARGGGFPPRGRGYRRGGPGRRPLATGPPPPPPQTPEERIRTLLIRACDKYVIGPGSAGDTNTNNSNDNNGVDPQLEVTEGDTLASSLRAIAGFIKRDTKTHTAQIPETLLECVKALPAKIPLYAALVGLLNDPEITGTLAGKLSEAISRLSDGSVSTSSDVRGFKLVLRFAVALCECNVLTVRSLCAVLDALAGLIGASSHDGARTDTCAYQLAMALAYAGAPLSKDSAGEGPEALKRCVDVLGKYVAARPAGPDDATAKICLSPWKEFSQPRQRDDGLTTVYNALRDGCWTLHCGFSVTADLADSLKEVVPVDLPAVSLQLPQEAADVPFEQAPFFLYDEESMHELSALDAVVLRDLYVDVMTLFQDIPKEAVGCLVHIPTPESAPCALYEAVLSQLLMLPTPPARIVYYQLLLVYLCKVDKKYVAQFKESVNIIFESVDKFDMECIDRVTEWLSWHLSNFEYVWSWALWSKHLHEDPSSVSQVKRNFVTDLLDKCIRLSSYDAIKAATPESLHEFLPPQPALAPSPSVYECPELCRAFEAGDMQEAARYVSERKPAPDTVLKVALALLSEGRVVSFMNCIDVLRSAGVTDELALSCLHECCPSLQYLSFAIAVLVEKKLVAPLAATKWLFSDASAQVLCRSAAWDIARKLMAEMAASAASAESSSASGMDMDCSETDASAAVHHILQFVLDTANGELPDASGNNSKSYLSTTVSEHAIEFVRKYSKHFSSDTSELISQLSCIDERLSDY